MRALWLWPLLLALLTGQARAAEQPELLLEVRLDQLLLADAIGAYQQGGEVLLPLGEVARLLTIAIRSDPAHGSASGAILDPQRPFHLDLPQGVVLHGAQRETFDPALVRREADDLYVASSLLARWLPLDLEIDLASLTLRVHAREKLPLQARLERQGKSVAATGKAPERGYPLVATPYRLARMPFADQTIGADLRHTRADAARTLSYTGYLTGELLGAEAALYLNTSEAAAGPVKRLTLGRHDPGAGLLGALKARTVQLGSVSAPGLAHIAHGSSVAGGVLVSNRALGLPLRFDQHTLQGDLPPGWDVELYFNEALIAIAQARPDGRYSFDNLPLAYGPNAFRLVFHGPLGQLRIERHDVLLEQSMLAEGQLDYSVSLQGRARGAALFDWGLGRRLSAHAGLLRMPVAGQARSYASLGLQAYLDRLIVSANAARSTGDGKLVQFGVKSRVGGLAVSASRALSDHFVSDFYLPSADPVRVRDELRADGMLASLPLMLQLKRERLASGLDNLEARARLSAFRRGTAVSQLLRWQALGGSHYADGLLAASRRMAGLGLSAQLQYTIRPDWAVNSVAVSADRHLAGGYLLSAAVTRSFSDPQTRLSAALNKSMGSFGLGLHGWYASRGEYGAGLQLFMALGQEPRSARWMADAAPMAASGSASLRVFLDKDGNGAMDGADTPIAGAGFLVNGATQLHRSGADGVAWIGRLPANQAADIALDPATLEDPQWQAVRPGVRMVARAGAVGQFDFAVAVTGEIDGSTWLQDQGARRAAGDVELELLDAQAKVVARTSSGADGYYLLSGVAPGSYRLRVAPAQLARLGLDAPPERSVSIAHDASLVSGQDFVLARARAAPRPAEAR